MNFIHDFFIGSDDKQAFFSFTKLTFFIMVIGTLFLTYEQLKWDGPFSKDAFQLFATITTSLLGYIIGKSAGADVAGQVSDAATASAATALTVPGTPVVPVVSPVPVDANTAALNATL